MGKKTKIVAITAVCLMILLQITALILFNGEQIEDSAYYRYLATEKVRTNSFYPDDADEFEKFVANPGLINYLSIFYRISSSDKLPIAANIILVFIMGISIYFIAWKLFSNKTVAWLSLLFLSIFPAYIGEILNLRSEILFTTLAYSAIAIFLSNIKFKYIICGILIALANWVRPMGLVFLLAIIIYMLMTKVKFINYIKLISAMICVVLIIGTASYISSGHFVFQSVTGGVNLIMGANDDADGSYNETVFNEGNLGYLPNYDDLSYKEKDSIWMKKSIEWIKQKPIKYLALIPAKLLYMYAVDTYAFSTFYNNEKITSGSDYISSLVNNVLHLKFSRLTWVDYIVIINQVIYMIYLLMFLIGIVFLLIKKFNSKEIIFLIAVIVFGTGMTIITVGGARYHYPYLPVIFIISAALLNQLILNRKSKHYKNSTSLE